MVRFRSSTMGWLLAAGLFIGAVSSTDIAAGEGKAAPARAGRPLAPPPMAKTPIHFTPEGLHFGMSSSELVDFYDKVLDQDYVPVYKVTPVGPKMKEVDAALAEQKSAFPRSEVTFGNLPTGIDNTPLKGEYNYKNDETMMSITRLGMTRYFFLQGKRLWKIYDAVPLRAGGELGASYQDAVTALTKRYGVAGRVLPDDAAHGRFATEVDWIDATTHVRVIDRTSESLAGVIFEDRSSADRMAAFKASQKNDDGAIDPTVAAVTRGGPAVDSNASAADAYTGKAHAGASNPPPPKKK
jgi:hypothetical protein